VRAPDKQRFLDALHHVETPDVPFQENDPDIELVNQILEKQFPLSLRPYEIPAEDLVELHLRLGNDMVFLTDLWELARKNQIDDEGRKHYVDGTIKCPQDFSQIEYPDLGNTEKLLTGVLTAAEGTGLGVTYAINNAPRLATVAIGYQDYCIALIDDPAFVHELQRRIHEYSLRELEMVLSVGVDMVQISVDLCINTGLMYSPAMIEEFQYPMIRQYVRRVKDAGRPVSIHADGDLTPVLPDFVEMGVDLLNPVEPCGRQDIYTVKRRWGEKLAIQGNIDVAGVLTRGTPDEVRADTIEHIEQLAPGGGYVVASSHNVTQDVPLANLLAMRDTAHAWRR